jgi:nicotinate dehydrogenase subunit B
LLGRASPLRTAHLRDPVGPQIQFASESLIDEIVAQWAPDPVAPRIRYLKEQRDIAVVAIIAEIEIDRRTDRIWARKFTVAHDRGLIINLDGLRRCIESHVVQGTGRALSEQVVFNRAKVTTGSPTRSSTSPRRPRRSTSRY